jgi:hypothetical protein
MFMAFEGRIAATTPPGRNHWNAPATKAVAGETRKLVRPSRSEIRDPPLYENGGLSKTASYIPGADLKAADDLNEEGSRLFAWLQIQLGLLIFRDWIVESSKSTAAS